MSKVTLFLAFLCLGVVGRVRGHVNVALGKPVWQQSEHPSVPTVPTHATDGFLDGHYDNRRCTATKNDKADPWLVIDLLDKVVVTEVRIKHRKDCCVENDFIHVTVSVGNAFDPKKQPSFNPSDFKKCAFLERSTGRDTMQTAKCETPVRGRFVALHMSGTRSLQVCEVEVAASNTSLTAVSVGKPTFSSSVHENFHARFATDGNYDGLFGNKHGFHSSKQHRPWLVIDLQRPYRVQFVTIKNREDSEAGRLNNVYVATSSQLMLGGDLSSWKICAFFRGDFYGGEILAAECNPVRSDRYVIVFLEADSYLQLTEVTAYALK